VATRDVGGADAALIMRYGTAGARQVAARERASGTRNPVYGINDLLPGGGRAQGTTARSGGTVANNQQTAGDAFYAWFAGITDSRQKTAVRAALDKNNVNPFGKKYVADDTYRRAIAVGNAVLNRRATVGTTLPGAAA
jgi:hypothetical protein